MSRKWIEKWESAEIWPDFILIVESLNVIAFWHFESATAWWIKSPTTLTSYHHSSLHKALFPTRNSFNLWKWAVIKKIFFYLRNVKRWCLMWNCNRHTKSINSAREKSRYDWGWSRCEVMSCSWDGELAIFYRAPTIGDSRYGLIDLLLYG